MEEIITLSHGFKSWARQAVLIPGAGSSIGTDGRPIPGSRHKPASSSGEMPLQTVVSYFPEFIMNLVGTLILTIN